ncbi:sulfotransferase family protein [Spongiibacter sp. IMCC21906]|uniref:sulfotransferase domain-containing protein n=1 Tax=Spongiibacter sp. IMCC21906 TaxID=1620392 RepID=UPI00062DCFD5|nr:sulfotransferase domain-containing protein [Spongiibacter sp. IMCC21906]AKH67849.1 sulfotransferase family protein [Spongiibacter sp. IMCC21906]
MDDFFQGVKSMLGLSLAARNNIDFRPTDIFLVSYPKSGNTWLRNLIANLVYHGQELDIEAIDKYVPDVYKTRQYKLRAMTGRRYLKSHEYFDDRYKCVINVVRDPRDVCVSYYFYLKKNYAISDEMGIDDFCKIFVNGEVDNFSSWSEHVGSWASINKNSKKYLLVRYEDIRLRPMELISEVASFVGVDVSAGGALHIISEKISFESMKEAEKKSEKKWKEVANTRSDIMFMRQGISGGWVDHLSEESVRLIEDTFRKEMKEYGYIE